MNQERRSFIKRGINGIIGIFLYSISDAYAKGRRTRAPKPTTKHQRMAKSLISRSAKTGGHINQRHIGKSNKYLASRVSSVAKRNNKIGKGQKIKRVFRNSEITFKLN